MRGLSRAGCLVPGITRHVILSGGLFGRVSTGGSAGGSRAGAGVLVVGRWRRVLDDAGDDLLDDG